MSQFGFTFKFTRIHWISKADRDPDKCNFILCRKLQAAVLLKVYLICFVRPFVINLSKTTGLFQNSSWTIDRVLCLLGNPEQELGHLDINSRPVLESTAMTPAHHSYLLHPASDGVQEEQWTTGITLKLYCISGRLRFGNLYSSRHL